MMSGWSASKSKEQTEKKTASLRFEFLSLAAGRLLRVASGGSPPAAGGLAPEPPRIGDESLPGHNGGLGLAPEAAGVSSINVHAARASMGEAGEPAPPFRRPSAHLRAVSRMRTDPCSLLCSFCNLSVVSSSVEPRYPTPRNDGCHAMSVPVAQATEPRMRASKQSR